MYIAHVVYELVFTPRKENISRMCVFRHEFYKGCGGLLIPTNSTIQELNDRLVTTFCMGGLFTTSAVYMELLKALFYQPLT